MAKEVMPEKTGSKMKEAMFYEPLDGMKVQCHLCPNECIIASGKTGSCNVRKNNSGKLYSLVYGLPCTAGVDPVEKKPLFHFLPGTSTYSIATPGCNLHCLWCQNWQISQKGPDQVPCFKMTPEEVVENAISHGCQSISYTYVEPAIFYEYMLDCAKLAHKKGLKNIMVTNGYLNPKPAAQLYKHIDACNIDLKGFTEEVYVKYCSGKLQPVLDNIKRACSMGLWVELTTLLIPGVNDDGHELRKMCEWIKDNAGPGVPLHLSRFFPYYRMADKEPTPAETLLRAHHIAKDAGLRHVYVGNMHTDGLEDTYCPSCGRKVIDRSRFFTVESNRLTKTGTCKNCKQQIEGVWSA